MNQRARTIYRVTTVYEFKLPEHPRWHVSWGGCSIPFFILYKTMRSYNRNLVAVRNCDNNFTLLFLMKSNFTLVTWKNCTATSTRTIGAICNCMQATKGCQAETADQVSATYRLIAFLQWSILTSEGIAAVYGPQLYLSCGQRERYKKKKYFGNGASPFLQFTFRKGSLCTLK